MPALTLIYIFYILLLVSSCILFLEYFWFLFLVVIGTIVYLVLLFLQVPVKQEPINMFDINDY